MTTQITNYGGRVVNLWVSNKDDDFENIVLGYDDIDKNYICLKLVITKYEKLSYFSF